MKLSTVGLMLASVTLSAVAQVAFKQGVSSPLRAVPAWLGVAGVLLSPGVLLGLALYGFGTLLWLTALREVELSQAYPFVGIGFALTTLAGWWLFGDTLSSQRVLGIALVFAGIVLVARS